MNTIQIYRAEIDRIDCELRSLFIQRMEIIAKISEWKAAHDLPIFDPSREVEVIKNNLDAIENEVMREYYHTVLLSLLKVSKDYQKSLALEGIL